MPFIKIKSQRENALEVHYAAPYTDVDGFHTEGFVQIVADDGAVVSDKEIGQLQAALAKARKIAYPRYRRAR